MNQGSGSGSGLWEEAWIKILITDLNPGGRNAPVKTLHGKNAKHHATARILPIQILLSAASLCFLLLFFTHFDGLICIRHLYYDDKKSVEIENTKNICWLRYLAAYVR